MATLRDCKLVDVPTGKPISGSDACRPGRPARMAVDKCKLHYFVHYMHRGTWDKTVPEEKEEDLGKIEAYHCNLCLRRFRNNHEKKSYPGRGSMMCHLDTEHGLLLKAMREDDKVDMTSEIEAIDAHVNGKWVELGLPDGPDHEMYTAKESFRWKLECIIKEVREWLAGILIKSSNDVEENPGPNMLDLADDDEVTFANIFCEHCGYISPDFVETGLHALECEGKDHEMENEYTCLECKDNKELIWGLETREVCKLVKEAYEKMVDFKRNTFTIPANKAGKNLLELYAETLRWAGSDGKEGHFGFHANTILMAICLQITDKKATMRQRTEQLKATTEKIRQGNLKQAIAEACAIQVKLKKKKTGKTKGRKTNWVSVMRQKAQEGELKAAARMLDESNSGVEVPSENILQRMGAMFPRRRANEQELPTPNPMATKLQHIRPKDIEGAIQKLQGSGGPSQLDARTFKRMIFSKVFNKEAEQIVHEITNITNKLSAKQFERKQAEPLVALRMVAIRKKDGNFRPVGISEILRRIITKVVAWEIKLDVKEVTGSRQCAGLPGACEAAIKGMDELYQQGKAVLVLDAEGAYNNLNRRSALIAVGKAIPDAYQMIKNFYEHPTRAFYGGKELTIEEGTIQGCALSSAVYDIGIQPLAKEMEEEGIVQVWLCDDLAAAGEPEMLRKWLRKLKDRAPVYGYHINKKKSYAIAKERGSVKCFEKEGVQITEGAKYLGAALGRESYKDEHMKGRLNEIGQKTQKLIQLAKTSPHSAYYVFSASVKHEVTYLQRIGMKDEEVKRLEVKFKKLAESLVGQAIVGRNTLEQVSNPTRYGGLAIAAINLMEETREMFSRGEVTSGDLKSKLINQDHALPIKMDMSEFKKQKEKLIRKEINEQIDRESKAEDKSRRQELKLKGTNNWIGAPPIKARGRYLNKNAFQDAVRMRLGLEPKNLSQKCACGNKNSVNHSRTCHIGGYINMRHDKVRDYIYDKAKMVYNDVEKETTLKPVEEQVLSPGAILADGARSDVRIMGFSRDFQDTHFDIKVINAQADTHLTHNPKEAMLKAEEGKDRAYKERIQKVENGEFMPILFTSRGARSIKTSRAMTKLANKIAAKRNQEKQMVIKGMSTDLSFLFLKIELACIRGNRRRRTANVANE